MIHHTPSLLKKKIKKKSATQKIMSRESVTDSRNKLKSKTTITNTNSLPPPPPPPPTTTTPEESHTKLYANSFIVSTTQLWNTLPQTIQANPLISLLKKYLSMNNTIVPIYYYFGSRKEQVKHCRLRLAISNLNYDLFRCLLLDDPLCSCGYTAETSEHFLLHCPLIIVLEIQPLVN